MLYALLRPVTRWAFLAFFRKITLSGLANVPRKGPVILAVNHPTAFLEPCFLACFLPRTLHFMTRGDIFANPWVKALLAQVHLIPIYRAHDGFARLRLNGSSFARAREVLGRDGALLIMAEGGMRHEKRLRPLQRGAARIGFGAMEEFGLSEVLVLPIGVNYTYAEKARQMLMVDIGPAFSLAELYPKYLQDPQPALEAVTDRIRTALEVRVVNIRRPEDEQLAEWVLRLVRLQQSSVWPFPEDSADCLQVEWAAIQALNELPSKVRHSLALVLGPWMSRMAGLGLPVDVVRDPPRPGWWNRVRCRLWSPVYFLIRGVHWPPVLLARWITRRSVSVIEFRSSVLLGSAMFSWLAWVLLLVLGIGFVWDCLSGCLALAVLAGSAFGLVLLANVRDVAAGRAKWYSLPVEEQEEILEGYRECLAAWRAAVQDKDPTAGIQAG